MKLSLEESVLINGVASDYVFSSFFHSPGFHSVCWNCGNQSRVGSLLIAYALDQPLHRCTKFRIVTDEALNFFHRVNNCRVMLPAELSCDVRVAGLRKALAKIHCYLPWKQDMASV